MNNANILLTGYRLMRKQLYIIIYKLQFGNHTIFEHTFTFLPPFKSKQSNSSVVASF